MGRGRQKAKQTKVARALKYHTASIDVTALQRELSGGGDEQDFGDSYDSDDADDPDAEDAAESDDDETADDYVSSRGHR